MLTIFDMLLLFIAIAVCLGRMAHRRSTWKRGRPENRPGSIFGVLSYVISHNKILRKPGTGLAHLILFWGFVFNIALVIFAQFNVTLPLTAARAVALVADILGIAMLGAVLFLLVRRIKNPRRTQFFEACIPLLVIILIILSGFLASGARLALVCGDAPWWSPVGTVVSLISPVSPLYMLIAIKLHFLSVLLFIVLLPFTLLRHLFATPLNIYYKKPHPLAPAAPLPLNQSAPGVGTFCDFTWKQLLDLEACTMCGRCEEACPASRAEKPLSPHKIVRSLLDQVRGYSLHTKSTAFDSPTLRDVVSPQEIWSCTTCGACNYECPSHLDIVEKIVDLRRNEIEQGNSPALSAVALEGIANRGNPWALPPTDRIIWAEQSIAPLIQCGETIDVLFWVGCAGSFDPLGQDISRAMTAVLNKAEVRYAILGNEERCCGEPARRLGEEGLFQHIARKNLATFAEYGIRTIVTPCPHCFTTFKHEYPLLGGDFQVYHHSQYLAELCANKRLTAIEPTGAGSVLYHDPCYVARYNDDIADARLLLERNLAVDLINTSSPQKTFCCGGGGGQMWLDIHEGDRIENVRMAQMEESGPDVIATGCPYCKIMFDTALASRAAQDKQWTPHIKDIAELLAERL